MSPRAITRSSCHSPRFSSPLVPRSRAQEAARSVLGAGAELWGRTWPPHSPATPCALSSGCPPFHPELCHSHWDTSWLQGQPKPPIHLGSDPELVGVPVPAPLGLADQFLTREPVRTSAFLPQSSLLGLPVASSPSPWGSVPGDRTPHHPGVTELPVSCLAGVSSAQPPAWTSQTFGKGLGCGSQS